MASKFPTVKINSAIPLNKYSVLVLDEDGVFWRVTVPDSGNECYWQRLKNVLVSDAFNSNKTAL